jgi:hypothetical protein
MSYIPAAEQADFYHNNPVIADTLFYKFENSFYRSMADTVKTLLSSSSYKQASEEDIDHRINKFSTQDDPIVGECIDTIRATNKSNAVGQLYPDPE